ncbi:hypothetical protein Droror1_Dr00008612 [Drosera rotundifolia]
METLNRTRERESGEIEKILEITSKKSNNPQEEARNPNPEMDILRNPETLAESSSSSCVVFEAVAMRTAAEARGGGGRSRARREEEEEREKRFERGEGTPLWRGKGNRYAGCGGKGDVIWSIEKGEIQRPGWGVTA